MRAKRVSALALEQAKGWRRSYISDLLRGRKYLHYDALLEVLDAAGIPPGEFFRGLYPDALPEVPAAAWPAPTTSAETHHADALRWLETRVAAIEQRVGIVPGLPGEAPPDSYLEDLVRRTVRQIEGEDREREGERARG